MKSKKNLFCTLVLRQETKGLRIVQMAQYCLENHVNNKSFNIEKDKICQTQPQLQLQLS